MVLLHDHHTVDLPLYHIKTWYSYIS